MAIQYAQVIFSVEGDHAYLFSTGKLREMLGASAVIASYPEQALSFCREELHLQEADAPQKNGAWFVILQNVAGSLRLLVPDADIAKKILSHVSLWSIEHCPGLPLYGTTVPCSWTRNDMKQAYRLSREAIAQKKSAQAEPPRSIWPFCRIAPVDGLPAIAHEGSSLTSIESLIRCSKEANASSQDKYRDVEQFIRQGKNVNLSSAKLEWPSDMNDLIKKGSTKKVALLHMNANDLGKHFLALQKEFDGDAGGKEDVETKKTTSQNKALVGLSKLAEEAARQAFKEALLEVICLDLKDRGDTPSSYTIPARPLLLEGDDLTLLMRMDLAFPFVDAYAAAYEAYTKKQKHHMSIGCGMFIMPRDYPFSRAISFVEALTESAKNATNRKYAQGEARPSSVDYLIITNDIGRDLDEVRQKSFTSRDGYLLTAKPFICGKPRQKLSSVTSAYIPDASLADVIADTRDMHTYANLLPSSKLRQAIDECREGRAQGKRAWLKLRENLARGLGGNKDALPYFDRIFPNEFFHEKAGENKRVQTLLGDYLELRKILYPMEEK